jgi:hypothetical protein
VLREESTNYVNIFIKIGDNILNEFVEEFTNQLAILGCNKFYSTNIPEYIRSKIYIIMVNAMDPAVKSMCDQAFKLVGILCKFIMYLLRILPELLPETEIAELKINLNQTNYN